MSVISRGPFSKGVCVGGGLSRPLRRQNSENIRNNVEVIAEGVVKNYVSLPSRGEFREDVSDVVRGGLRDQQAAALGAR